MTTESKSFSTAFTLPFEYLPKKKKAKLAASGKTKLPSVGTSDEWWKVQMEKEEEQRAKREESTKKKLQQLEKKKKAEEKKKQAEEKKKLVEEKKKLKQKIESIQKQLKKEKK